MLRYESTLPQVSQLIITDSLDSAGTENICVLPTHGIASLYTVFTKYRGSFSSARLFSSRFINYNQLKD